MLKTHYHKDIIWYDFFEPSAESFEPLVKKYGIDRYIVKKLTTETNRDKALILGDNLFLSLSFPNLSNGEFQRQEIKFVIGRKYIITSQTTINEGLQRFAKNFEKKASFEKNEEYDNCVVYVFLHMIEKIYENMIYELKGIEKEIEKIEEEIFLGNEKKMVRTISETNRRLMGVRKHTNSHKRTWELFLELSEEYFVKKSSHTALRSILLSYEKASGTARELQEILWELRDTNNSLLYSKQNETMNTFTLIAFLTLPISLFISIISIPTVQENHILGQKYDFYITLAIITVIFVVMVIISKLKKWW